MYSVEELIELRNEMKREAEDRDTNWFVERDIALFETLCEFWTNSELHQQNEHILTLLVMFIGLKGEKAAEILADLQVSFTIGVQFGYEIRQRQEVARAVQE